MWKKVNSLVDVQVSDTTGGGYSTVVDLHTFDKK